MTFALQLVYTLASFAAMLLLAQGAVWVLSFGNHLGNPVYRFISLLTSPVTKIVRKITPQKVHDKHVPVVAFFLLLWVCLGFALLLPSLAKVA